jgi:1,4-alpha-glucan branching enzyme
MSYNEAERYILVLSHDEVVHLKGSMLAKMPGLDVDKYKNLMAGYAFMMGHPGKKLLFMGQDFAQGTEWSEARELDWYVLDNPNHRHVSRMFKELLHIYRAYPAMYEQDVSWAGFEWINANDSYRSIFSFVRKAKNGKNSVLFVINMTPMKYEDYKVGVPENRKFKLLLDSQDPKFGGEGSKIAETYTPRCEECDGREYSIAFPVAPYQVAIFVY